MPWETLIAIGTTLGAREILAKLLRHMMGRPQSVRAELEITRRKWERCRQWRMALEEWAHRARLQMIALGVREADLPPLPPAPPEVEPLPDRKTD